MKLRYAVLFVSCMFSSISQAGDGYNVIVDEAKNIGNPAQYAKTGCRLVYWTEDICSGCTAVQAQSDIYMSGNFDACAALCRDVSKSFTGDVKFNSPFTWRARHLYAYEGGSVTFPDRYTFDYKCHMYNSDDWRYTQCFPPGTWELPDGGSVGSDPDHSGAVCNVERSLISNMPPPACGANATATGVSWNASGTDCTLTVNGVSHGGVSCSGSKDFAGSAPGTYAATVNVNIALPYPQFSGGYSSSCSASYVAAPPAPRCSNIAVTPEVGTTASTFNATWAVSNATTCTRQVSGGIKTNVSCSGSAAVPSRLGTNTVTVAATGPGGSTSCSDTYTVNAVAPSYVKFSNAHTGLCLGGDSVGPVGQACKSTWTSQQFQLISVVNNSPYVQIKHRFTGKCLGDNKSKLEWESCANTGWWSEQWELRSGGTGGKHVVNRYSGLVLGSVLTAPLRREVYNKAYWSQQWVIK